MLRNLNLFVVSSSLHLHIYYLSRLMIFCVCVSAVMTVVLVHVVGVTMLLVLTTMILPWRANGHNSRRRRWIVA